MTPDELRLLAAIELAFMKRLVELEAIRQHRLDARVAAGGVPCTRCGQPIVGRFNLDDLPSGELHPSHQTCNRSAGRQ